ncbi:unnamed protein product [Strongylus vulgaris]|uniref:Uncharacterized protein n=1 Tax=Strongylus vulgaris TaxID=40348 RepID=A0A3P7JF60_STRVU|nr:unnamed protein product [Strongylus vulgaris]
MLQIFLLLFICTVAPLSVVRDFSTTEKAPFSAEAGIFSNEETSQAFPMAPDTDFEEARERTRIGDASIIVDAKPPGFEPQPPGIEETSEMLKNKEDIAKFSTTALKDYPTTAPLVNTEYASVDSAVESFDDKDFPVEQEEASGEHKITTGSSHADVEFSSPNLEGSGQELLNRSVEKVSGEVGQHEVGKRPCDARQSTVVEVAVTEQIVNNETTTTLGYSDTSYGDVTDFETTVDLSTVNYDSTVVPPVTSTEPATDQYSTVVLEATSTIPTTDMLALESTSPSEQELPGSAVLAVSVTQEPSETTAIIADYEAPHATISVSDITPQTTTVLEQNYDGVPLGSSYEMLPQTPGFEQAPVHHSSLDTLTTPADQKHLQDFSETARDVDVGNTILKAPDVKKTSTSRTLAEPKTFNGDNDLNSIVGKTALVGPPAHRAPPRRGAVEGCPEPGLCAKNCFVYINERGCQDCQCLWQALSCDIDDDCPETAQYCDLGKCNCRPGMRQDMGRSGFCELDPEFKGPLPSADLEQIVSRLKREASNDITSTRNDPDSIYPEEIPSATLSRVS